MAAFLPRFLWTLVVLVLLIVLGTLVYVWIEAQPLSDALYMTAITLTAVGYSEVFDVSPSGRTFTIFLLLCGISWMGLRKDHQRGRHFVIVLGDEEQIDSLRSYFS